MGFGSLVPAVIQEMTSNLSGIVQQTRKRLPVLSFAKSGMCTIENFPPEQGGFSFARDEIRPD